MAVFSTDVAVRWSDMDIYGHVNNARVVTLLEEARTELLFSEGARRGARTLANGVVVVELLVRYQQPVLYSARPVRVRLWVNDLRAASFVLHYAVAGTDGDAVTARTQLAPYDTETRRPRRLMPAEREFLATFHSDQPGA
ncbi:MAG TPA: thioesterase family protein [Pseudonocardiaceae bacterium]|jgi:acyl-CoA thioester hydrolase